MFDFSPKTMRNKKEKPQNKSKVKKGSRRKKKPHNFIFLEKTLQQVN